MSASKAGRTKDHSRILRCSACGHRLETPDSPSCSLCGFTFADDRITGADVSPYAVAYTHGRSGWRTMSEWVWFSGSQRLKHIALMRASAASGRFARMNIALLVIGLGLFQTTQVGWRWVTDLPALEPSGSTQPAGDGWLHLAATPRPLPPDLPGEVKVDLWWSMPQAGLAASLGMVNGALFLWFTLLLLRGGVTWAHRPPYRAEQRMTAALHYGTAWLLLLSVATLVAGLRPVAYVGAIARWGWYPLERGFVLAAAVVAGLGVCLWWFWLIRLSATAPSKTRDRVAAFFAVGAPLIIVGAATGWYFSVQLLHEALVKALKLGF